MGVGLGPRGRGEWVGGTRGSGGGGRNFNDHFKTARL